MVSQRPPKKQQSQIMGVSPKLGDRSISSVASKQQKTAATQQLRARSIQHPQDVWQCIRGLNLTTAQTLRNNTDREEHSAWAYGPGLVIELYVRTCY